MVGTAVSKVCHLEIARTGLRERDATRAGFGYVTVTVRSTTKAGDFPGTQRINVKMTAERCTGRLLGVQIVGQEGSAKRIDTAATALWNRMTVEEMTALDLAYAPPFAPVWIRFSWRRGRPPGPCARPAPAVTFETAVLDALETRLAADQDVRSVKGAATRAPRLGPGPSGIEKHHGVAGPSLRWKAGMTPRP